MICKNLKRIICIALSILLILAGLVACKNTNEDDKSADLSSSQNSEDLKSSEIDSSDTSDSHTSTGNVSSTGGKLPPTPDTGSNNSSNNSSANQTTNPNPDLPNPPDEKEYSAVIGDVSLPVDMDLLKQLKVNIVTPEKYSAWPMLGTAKGRLVCLYTVADQHSATESKLYMKTSSSNGFSWTAPKEIFTDKTGVKGITGTGNDSKGNMLIWYRNGSPGAWQTTHELYKTNGDQVVQVSLPDFALRGGHIGNIFSVKGELFCFYNTYGNTRSWGLLKSADDGLSWEQIPIEENVSKAECPVEIEGVYLKDGKILALGRKDSSEGTVAMFQIQSSDYGKTWSKEYTNITDALGSSPSMILDSNTGKISLYFFARTTGQLKRRAVNYKDVWNKPQNWSDSEILESENARGQDTGNVKTTAINGLHIATYYAGSSTTTGIYGVIIKD